MLTSYLMYGEQLSGRQTAMFEGQQQASISLPDRLDVMGGSRQEGPRIYMRRPLISVIPYTGRGLLEYLMAQHPIGYTDGHP